MPLTDEFKLYNYTFQLNETALCYNFYNFPSGTSILYIVASNLTYFLLDFSNSNSPKVQLKSKLSSPFPKFYNPFPLISKCQLTRISYGLPNYILSLSFQANQYYETVTYIYNANLTQSISNFCGLKNQYCFSVKVNAINPLTDKSYDFDYFELTGNGLNFVMVQDGGVAYRSIVETPVEIYPPVFSTWVSGNHSLLFISNKENFVVLEYDLVHRFQVNLNYTADLFEKDDFPTFFKIYEGESGIMHVGTFQGQVRFLYVSGLDGLIGFCKIAIWFVCFILVVL